MCFQALKVDLVSVPGACAGYEKQKTKTGVGRVWVDESFQWHHFSSHTFPKGGLDWAATEWVQFLLEAIPLVKFPEFDGGMGPAQFYIFKRDFSKAALANIGQYNSKQAKQNPIEIFKALADSTVGLPGADAVDAPARIKSISKCVGWHVAD